MTVVGADVFVRGLCGTLATNEVRRRRHSLVCAESPPQVDTFVAWNARHFVGKTRLEVPTSAEFFARQTEGRT